MMTIRTLHNCIRIGLIGKTVNNSNFRLIRFDSGLKIVTVTSHITIVYDPKMEDTCSCPLQTLVVWVVAVDVLISVCYGWKEALNK